MMPCLKLNGWLLTGLLAFSLATAPMSRADSHLPVHENPSIEFLALDPQNLEGLGTIPGTRSTHSANEKRLIQVMKAWARGDLPKATQLAESLMLQAPNYALAHLVYADLLRLQIPQDPNSLDIESHENHMQIIDQSLSTQRAAIQARQLEMSLRLRAVQQTPAQGMGPKHILSIGQHYRQLVVADTQLGRLHIFNIRHLPKQTRLELKHSFFLTIGDQGPGKEVEGDKKTPLGIYQLLDRIPQDILSDLYGSGALNINYPNPVDRKLGRTGHGIWFHGSPSLTYVRNPKSSDGCLVLSNDDMNLMLAGVTPQQTLVIIDDGVEWKPTAEWADKKSKVIHPAQKQWSALTEALKNDLSSLNPETFYEGGAKWEYRLLRLVRSNKNQEKDIRVDNLTVVEWRLGAPYVLVEFDFQLHPNSKIHRVRQYWMNSDGDWKVAREAILSS